MADLHLERLGERIDALGSARKVRLRSSRVFQHLLLGPQAAVVLRDEVYEPSSWHMLLMRQPYDSSANRRHLGTSRYHGVLLLMAASAISSCPPTFPALPG